MEVKINLKLKKIISLKEFLYILMTISISFLISTLLFSLFFDELKGFYSPYKLLAVMTILLSITGAFLSVFFIRKKKGISLNKIKKKKKF